ncbi:hypothetical protein EIP91_007315 [Steccherinum ochraceum]|uniref:Inosine/uridine-preferring nucleoside hydrolase domain-containing protein n=1 Tax=Steccherinum ochraceum TaxID=92696 RepID=A0A4R0S277_9APHY|nr:hypothetical protein EIP91_007315 [Steccherinum ochraceum]
MSPIPVITSPELRVLAIIVSFGNTDVDACYLNIIRLYEVLSKQLQQHPEDQQFWPNFSPDHKIILARGATGPLEGESHTAQYFHGRDGLGDISKRFPEYNTATYAPGDDHPHLVLTNKSGVDVALDLIQSEPSESISYLVLGPMTTLAQVVKKSGETFKQRIGRVICMGGALDVPGNTSPVAEFNFFADPYAVHSLLTPSPTSDFPLSKFLLLPLDITTPHELPFPYYSSIIDPTFSIRGRRTDPDKPLTSFTSAFLERTREVMMSFGKAAMELHDICVVWCAIDHPSLTDPSGPWKFSKREFTIERTGEITRGMLVIDWRDDQGAYAPGANRAAVQAELEKHPEFHPLGTLESTAVPAQVEVEDAAHAHPPPSQGTFRRQGAVDTTSVTAQLQAEDVVHAEPVPSVKPVPAPRSLEDGEGVIVVRETPGSEKLLRLLAKRVWGVDR